LSTSVSVGGDGGDGGDGSDVHIANSGGIETSGFDSRGIFAQSVGGGGGNGGSSSASPTAVTPNYSLAVAVSVGGKGGAGGSGGDVTVENDGKVFTWGSGSHAIQAQSV